MNTLKLKKDIDYEIKEDFELYLKPNKKFFNKNGQFKYKYIKLILKDELWYLELNVNMENDLFLENENFYCYFQEIKGEGFLFLDDFMKDETDLIGIELY